MTDSDMGHKKLNIRQGRFAALIASGKTAADAVREAGYKPSTDESARVCGLVLMRREEIQEEIARVRSKFIHEIDKSFQTLIDLRDSAESEGERRRCAEAVLDRLGAGVVKETHQRIERATITLRDRLPKRD